MNTIQVILKKALSSRAVESTIRYKIKYHYRYIDNVSIDGNVMTLSYTNSVYDSEHESIKVSIYKIIENYDKINIAIKNKVIRQSNRWNYDISEFLKDVYQVPNYQVLTTECSRFAEDLINILNTNNNISCGVKNTNQGVNIYCNEYAKCFDVIDDFLTNVFTLCFGCEDIKVPSMVDVESIDRVGYFQTGSHHLNFVSAVNTDPSVFDKYTSRAHEEDFCDYISSSTDFYQFTSSPQYVLNPALCLHCYPLEENQKLSTGDIRSYTVQGKCFRNESGNLNNTERLLEFSMREGVFFCTHSDLPTVHNSILALMKVFAVLLGNAYRIETANDIFFDDNADKQLFSQMISDNKIELVAVLGNKKEFSLASVNKHQLHFSKPYNITETESDSHATSLCIGFGYNRIVEAILYNVKTNKQEFLSHLDSLQSIDYEVTACS